MGTLPYLQLEVVWVFLPVIGAIDARRTIRGIKADTYRRVLQPATNIEDTRGFVRKHDGGRAPHICLDMHFAPSMVKIINETQVKFVCASRVFELRRGVFLEERHLAVYTDSSKQRRHETGDKVLNEVIARLCVYGKGKFSYVPHIGRYWKGYASCSVCHSKDKVVASEHLHKDARNLPSMLCCSLFPRQSFLYC